MFSLTLLNQNLSEIKQELNQALKRHRVTPLYAACVGSCVYQMRTPNQFNLDDFVYSDVDILVLSNNLQSNQALNFTHTFKNFKLDIQALAATQAQELITSHYLFSLEAALAPSHLVFCSPPKSLLANFKFSPTTLKARSEKVMTDTLQKSFNLLTLGFAQSNLELISQGQKLTWQAMRVDLMTHYLINHPPYQIEKSEELKTDFFSIANIHYEKLYASKINVDALSAWIEVVSSVSNNFALNDFNVIFSKIFSPNKELVDVNKIALIPINGLEAKAVKINI